MILPEKPTLLPCTGQSFEEPDTFYTAPLGNYIALCSSFTSKKQLQTHSDTTLTYTENESANTSPEHLILH